MRLFLAVASRNASETAMVPAVIHVRIILTIIASPLDSINFKACKDGRLCCNANRNQM